ncbi:MAG: DUF4430 domain-containing protein [Clostridia bacterium]|nr:MAG: DUF4430 domain-containing protein [Clostridia bacterium]
MHDRRRVTIVLLAALVMVAALGFWSWQVTSGDQPAAGPGASPGGEVAASGEPVEHGGGAGGVLYPHLPQVAAKAGNAPGVTAPAEAGPAGSHAPQAAPEDTPAYPPGEEDNEFRPPGDLAGSEATGGALAGAALRATGAPAGESAGRGKTAALAGGTTEKPSVSLVVTRDFGRQVLLDKEAELESAGTVLALLQGLAKVDTGYGGNFVRGINGLSSEPGRDWFYYVNGVAAGVGAGEYRLQSGDRVWWDYHSWQASGLVPAVVGSYPYPFRPAGGGRTPGPVIMFTPEAARAVDGLQEAWASLGIEVEVKVVDEAVLEQRPAPVLLLGTWAELEKLSSVKELNQRGARVGIFARFTSDGIELLDAAGDKAAVLKAGAAIQATGQGLGDAAPLWLVVGTERKWVEAAVRLMRQAPDQLHQAYGLALGEDGATRLPAE